MLEIILLFHIAVAIIIIAVVLLQQGKGASMGASFGSGSNPSQSVFGSKGNAPFLFKVTAIFMTCFFITSLGLNHLSAVLVEKSNELNIQQPKIEKVENKENDINSIPIIFNKSNVDESPKVEDKKEIIDSSSKDLADIPVSN